IAVLVSRAEVFHPPSLVVVPHDLDLLVPVEGVSTRPHRVELSDAPRLLVSVRRRLQADDEVTHGAAATKPLLMRTAMIELMAVSSASSSSVYVPVTVTVAMFEACATGAAPLNPMPVPSTAIRSPPLNCTWSSEPPGWSLKPVTGSLMV